MGVKTFIKKSVTKRMFSIERRNAKRRKVERERQANNAPHLVEYYHEAGDPYSHLMVQVLPEFCRRFDVELKINLVAPPPDWAAPEREKLESYARTDAARLAERAGLKFNDAGRQPSREQIEVANTALSAALGNEAFFEQAEQIGAKLWANEDIETSAHESANHDAVLQDGAEQRDAKGHYLGATLLYGGEWYWGLDRLHYLEERLTELGAATGGNPSPIFVPPSILTGSAPASSGDRPEIHWYLSFRSPYTGIVADRIKALADAYGADLKLRFVLPMVMRGMEIRRSKGFYIMSDVVREAERLGIPFGDICDPVGKPVERGYAILHRAIELGKGYEFAKSFLSGVWSEGIDAGSDAGLKRITERAGLSWAEMKPLLGTEDWREVEERNQAEMLSYDVWGVPSFRVGDTAAWGQDRLWVTEDALKAAASSNDTSTGAV